MPPPLRLAMLIGSFQRGGTELQLVELCARLRDRGHEVVLLALRDAGPLGAEARQRGVPTEALGLPTLRPLASAKGKLGALGVLGRTRRLLRGFQPDVVHAWLFEAELWAALIRATGAPGRLVTSRQSLGLYKDASWWMQPAQNGANLLASAVVANGRTVARDTARRERFIPRIQRVIRNGVEMDRFAAAQPLDWRAVDPRLGGPGPRALCVANLFAYKGHADLLEAWPRVLRRHPGARLLCVGRDGGEGAALRRQIERNALEGSVVLAGERGDVPGLLAGADLFVLPSHEEGAPNAVVEAMAAGLPVVASAVGGVPEMVVRGRTGLLVPPRHPERLAEAIIQAFDDRERLHEWGTVGQQRARSLFGMDRFVDEHEALYRRLSRA